jgi:hypothetical protein
VLGRISAAETKNPVRQAVGVCMDGDSHKMGWLGGKGRDEFKKLQLKTSTNTSYTDDINI